MAALTQELKDIVEELGRVDAAISKGNVIFDGQHKTFQQIFFTRSMVYLIKKPIVNPNNTVRTTLSSKIDQNVS